METEYTVKRETEFAQQVRDNDYIEEFGSDFNGNIKEIGAEIIRKICEDLTWRSFGEGLTDCIKEKTDYNGAYDDADKKTDYILEKLKNIGYCPKRSVVESWFSNKDNHPQRSNVYKICFALDLDIERVEWFFGHVYQEKSFNCRDVEDAVYYVALKSKRLSYAGANEIIDAIQNMKKTAGYEDRDGEVIYTTFVIKELDKISESENPYEELSGYLKANLSTFMKYNNTAKREVNELLSDIRGDEETNRRITDRLADLKKYNENILNETNNINDQWNKARKAKEEIRQLQDKASLPLQEFCKYKLYYQIGSEDLKNELSYISRISLMSNASLLRDIYFDNALDKEKHEKIQMKNIKEVKIAETPIPYGLLNNFPEEKTLSTVTKERKDKATYADKAYDGIRKLIILLKFYKFWAKAKIEDQIEKYYEEHEEENEFHNPYAEVFKDEMNVLLCECGCAELYKGNPYDYLFLLLSETTAPLDIFREVMGVLVDGGKE